MMGTLIKNADFEDEIKILLLNIYKIFEQKL